MTSMTTRRFLKTASMMFAGLVLAACGKQEPPAAAPAASAPAEPASAAAAPAPAKVYAVGTDAAYAPSNRRTRRARSSA